jgi:hypothetical protein
MITSVVCGSGSGVRVGSVDVQVRCIVIFVLGHCVLHIPGIVPPVVFAVFHGSLKGAVQSDTSLPCCAITSNATMQSADNEWTPEENRRASMRFRIRPRFTRKLCSIVNSCIMAVESMFISLGIALLGNLLQGRQRGIKALFEVLTADSRYPVKLFPDSSALSAKL